MRFLNCFPDIRRAKSLYLTQHLMGIMLLKNLSNNFPHLAQQQNRDQMTEEHFPKAWMKDPSSKKVIPNGVMKKVPPKRAIKVGVTWLEVRRKRFPVTLLWD